MVFVTMRGQLFLLLSPQGNIEYIKKHHMVFFLTIFLSVEKIYGVF